MPFNINRVFIRGGRMNPNIDSIDTKVSIAFGYFL